MLPLTDKLILITGASSGIGEACARIFAPQQARLLLVARRVDRLDRLAEELRGAGSPAVQTLDLDVRSSKQVAEMLGGLPDDWKEVDVLVNNAGLSRGLEPLHEGNLDDWNEMIDTNVKGLLHVDRTVVPWMVRRGHGTVVHIGSIAGRQIYPGGNVYSATKHAVRALTESLRLDLLGSGIRVGSVDPGMVATEFSEVRFHGDTERANSVYAGMTPLTADDVAEAVLFAATRPPHVNVADIMLLPVDQASATGVHRKRR